MRRFRLIFALFLALLMGFLIGTQYDKTWTGRSDVGAESNDDLVSVMLVGDVMLSRGVGYQMIKRDNYLFPFEKVGPFLASADITFGNLECAVLPGRRIKSGEFMFRADPGAVEGLSFAGFDVLSLANNHSLNFGHRGLVETQEYLRAAGIDTVGAGQTIVEAHRPVFKRSKGMTFAFLAYANTSIVPASYVAGRNSSGTTDLNVAQMEKDVRFAKGLADVVIVSMHAGDEYVLTTPNAAQRKFAYRAIDAGARVVVGHHPHVVQEIERRGDGLIFYSLGNFVFDQMWSRKTREGAIVELNFGGDGSLAFQVYPTVIESYAQPRFADGEEAMRIKMRMKVSPRLASVGGS